MTEFTPFTQKVMAALRKIPHGRVATYQQVAGLAGRSHAARAVAWILNSSAKKHGLPWQRVVSKEGRLAFKPGTYHFRMQRSLLLSEGVEVDARNGAIDMKRFQYRKRPKRAKPKRGQPRLLG